MRFWMALMLVNTALAQGWVTQNSPTMASLRGLSVVDGTTAWASGTGGTYLKTTDGGKSWVEGKVPGAEDLDFRDVHASKSGRVWLLSIGAGAKSRVYQSADGGTNWKVQFTNPDAQGFWDALAFWDDRRGILVGDPVDGRSVVFTTADGGEHWERRKTPDSVGKEGSFAASGTCLIVGGEGDAWYATGGTGGARVFHSSDGGASWTVATTPIRNDSASAGIFSLAFEGKNGIAVGGDYSKPGETTHNIAITDDGGKTWTEPAGPPPSGFRSAVAYLRERKAWVATGTSGSDVSMDGGKSWKAIDAGNYNAIAFASSADGWAVGPKGALGKWKRE